MIHRDMLRASFFGENLIEPDQKEESSGFNSYVEPNHY